MSEFARADHTTKWLPVKDLAVIWDDAQREQKEKRVTELLEDFDAEAFGVITVAKPNGEEKYHVIDGQHRVEAVRRMWGENEKVPCNIIGGADRKRAADIFSKVNTNRAKPNALSLFRVNVTAGYETEVGLQKLLTGMGYRVAMDGSPNTISAIGTCMTIYRHWGADILTTALHLIRGAWGNDRSATEGAIIRGMAMLVRRFGETLDKQRLVDRLAKETTPGRLIGTARAQADALRVSLAEGALRTMVAIYNHGLRTNRLDLA